MRGSVQEAERIATTTPGAFFVHQFNIPIDREIHRQTTGLRSGATPAERSTLW